MIQRAIYTVISKIDYCVFAITILLSTRINSYVLSLLLLLFLVD